MNNRLLEILNCVDQVNTITELAHKLYLTQPYVSNLISHGEQKYGSTLVKRDQKPISLTYAGERVRYYLTRISQLQKKLNNELTEINQTQITPLKIEINRELSSTYGVGEQIATKLTEQYVNVQTNILETGFDQGIQELVHHDATFYIGPNPHQKKLRFDQIGLLTYDLIISKNNKLNSNFKDKSFLELTDLKKLPKQSRIQAEDKIIDDFLREHRLDSKIAVSFSTFINAIRTVSRGIGYCICPTQSTTDLKRQRLDLFRKIKAFHIDPKLFNCPVGISSWPNPSSFQKEIRKFLFKNLQIEKSESLA